MGSWGTLGPELLSLAGVALGAGGSLFGQVLVSRASARPLDTQESAAHRAELKNVILKRRASFGRPGGETADASVLRGLQVHFMDAAYGRCARLPLEDRLLLVTAYWRTNLTLGQLTLLLVISKSAANRMVDHLGSPLAVPPRMRIRKDTALIVDGTLAEPGRKATQPPEQAGVRPSRGTLA